MNTVYIAEVIWFSENPVDGRKRVAVGDSLDAALHALATHDIFGGDLVATETKSALGTTNARTWAVHERGEDADDEGCLWITEEQVIRLQDDKLADLRESLRLIDGMRQQNLDAAAAAIQRAEMAESEVAAFPRWEALYEPGNVSSHFIGYLNDEASAKAAAEGWLRSQTLDQPGTLRWDEFRTDPSRFGYDVEHRLREIDDNGVEIESGVLVQHRADPKAIRQ